MLVGVQLLYHLSIALILFTWQPVTAETTETLALDRYALRLTVMPDKVTTGDRVALLINLRPRDDTPDDIYFWVDTVGIAVDEVTVSEGRLRCTYRGERLLCFAENVGEEQVMIAGIVTGLAPDRRYFWLSAGSFDGGFVRLALRLTWRQFVYFPLVGNGNNPN